MLFARQNNGYKAGKLVFLAFVLTVNANVFAQSLLDSVLCFYNKKKLSYAFTETRHLSNDKVVIAYEGKAFSYKEKDSVFYRVDFGSQKPALKYEAVKNPYYYGRNDYLRNAYYDYNIKKEGAHYFHDGNTPGHVFMQHDGFLARMFRDTAHIKIISQEAGYLVIHQDTSRENSSFGLSYWVTEKYLVSKRDYSILSSEYDMVYLSGKADLHNRSEFSYAYYESPLDSVREKVNDFIPLTGIKSEKPSPDLNLPDSVLLFPSFRLSDTSFKVTTEKDIRSRFVAVDFWYKGCGPCLANMKNLATLRKSFSAEELQVVVIDTHEKSDADLKRLVRNFDNGCLFLFEGQALVKPLNIKGYPTTLLYDNSTKKIIYHHVGGSAESTGNLTGVLREYLKAR